MKKTIYYTILIASALTGISSQAQHVPPHVRHRMEAEQRAEAQKAFEETVKVIDVTSMEGKIEEEKMPEVDFPTRPYGLNGDYSLIDLERANASLDTKVKGMGYGGFEAYFSTFSPKSNVRFRSGGIPRFVIEVGDDVDPSNVVTMARAEIKKGKRKFLQSSRKMMGGANDITSVMVSLQFRKIRTGLYEIVIDQELSAGEYAFMPMSSGGSVGSGLLGGGSAKITCFGVD